MKTDWQIELLIREMNKLAKKKRFSCYLFGYMNHYQKYKNQKTGMTSWPFMD